MYVFHTGIFIYMKNVLWLRTLDPCSLAIPARRKLSSNTNKCQTTYDTDVDWISYTDLDLDLVPIVPPWTLGSESSPSGIRIRSLATLLISFCKSSMSVSCHVLFGLSLLLLSLSGVQFIAMLTGLDVERRSTCPMNLLRLTATASCKLPMPALLATATVCFLPCLASTCWIRRASVWSFLSPSTFLSRNDRRVNSQCVETNRRTFASPPSPIDNIWAMMVV